jgi:hypothetical protein
MVPLLSTFPMVALLALRRVWAWMGDIRRRARVRRREKTGFIGMDVIFIWDLVWW